MAKRTKKKKAAKKRRSPIRPAKKVVTVQSRTTTVGKARRSIAKNAAYHIRQATDKLYSELGSLMIKKEKARTKTDRKKIMKKISEKRRQISRLK